MISDFVRGVVDSNDLPLNVSREILQESKDVEVIRKGCVNKVLGLLEDLAENQKEKYARFWKECGSVFKEGTGEDGANKERIARLIYEGEGTAITVPIMQALNGSLRTPIRWLK